MAAGASGPSARIRDREVGRTVGRDNGVRGHLGQSGGRQARSGAGQER